MPDATISRGGRGCGEVRTDVVVLLIVEREVRVYSCWGARAKQGKGAMRTEHTNTRGGC